MIDVEKEYKVLLNKLNRYKTQKLGFECGCATGYVTEINLIDSPYIDGEKAIEIKGVAGLDTQERVLMTISKLWRKGTDYKYWKDYHILEYYPKAALAGK